MWLGVNFLIPVIGRILCLKCAIDQRPLSKCIGQHRTDYHNSSAFVVPYPTPYVPYTTLHCNCRALIHYVRALVLGSVEFRPVTVYDDKQEGFQLAHDPRISQNRKHMNVCYPLSKALVSEETIRAKYVSSAERHAEALTKPCPMDSFDSTGTSR